MQVKCPGRFRQFVLKSAGSPMKVKYKGCLLQFFKINDPSGWETVVAPHPC